MEQLSDLIRPCTLPLPFPDQDWLADHHFMGRPVLPAVIGMQWLQHAARQQFPQIHTEWMREAVFDRFLFLPACDGTGERAAVTLEIEFRMRPGDELVETGLYSRSRAPSGIARRKRHVFLVLGEAGRAAPSEAGPPLRILKPDNRAKDLFTVAPQRVYQELVPLGPAFRNIVGTLQLFPDGALSRVSGGRLAPAGPPVTPSDATESALALDAAMHAACVWSQRYANCVAFPVGFERRRIQRPCRYNSEYDARVAYCGQRGHELLFDIQLADAAGDVCEEVSNLRMRDVSGGRWMPPSWVRARR